MPDPWDTANIKFNLKVLAALKTTEFFRADPNTGHLVPVGVDGFNRMTGDEVESAAHDAVLVLVNAVGWSEAGGQWSGDGKSVKPPVFVAESEITAAQTNLQKLAAQSTLSTAKPHFSHMATSAAKARPQRPFATGFDRKLFVQEKEKFTRTYALHRKLQVHQNELTMIGQEGICKAMCFDWVRRRLVEGKLSYGKGEQEKHAPPLNDRLQSRAEARLHELQRGYAVVQQTHKNPYEPIHNLVGKVRKNTTDPNATTGLDRLVEKPLSDIGKSSEWYVGGRYDQTAYQYPKRNELFAPVHKACTQMTSKLTTKAECCFILSLGSSRHPHGHAVVLDYRAGELGKSLYFFDPNYGEYEFAVGDTKSLEQFHTFFGELWKLYALQGEIYDRWSLDQFTAKG